MARSGSKENRQSARIAVSKGVWVAWQSDGPRNVSRVRDLSVGGVFISTSIPVAVGTEVDMLFRTARGVRHAYAASCVTRTETTASEWNLRPWEQRIAYGFRNCYAVSTADFRQYLNSCGKKEFLSGAYFKVLFKNVMVRAHASEAESSR